MSEDQQNNFFVSKSPENPPSEKNSGKRRWRGLVRRFCLETFTKCEECGYDKSSRILHFHHINPREKDGSVLRCFRNRGERAGLEEITKCVTLCPNCHAEVHANIRQLKKTVYYNFEELYEKFQEFKKKNQIILKKQK
jgi:5-methylcytosine-specific restriction endonuclease McrA